MCWQSGEHPGESLHKNYEKFNQVAWKVGLFFLAQPVGESVSWGKK